MRFAALIALAFGAGCLSLAGLDEDYVGGSTGAVGSEAANVSSSGDASGGAASVGGTGGMLSGAGGTGAAGAVGYCEEAGLIACYPFEGNGDDASMSGNDATTSAVQYAAGRVGQAIVLDTDSLVTVAPSQSLAVTAVTLEVWVNPSELPEQGARFGIADWTVLFDVWIYPWGVRCHYDSGAMVGSPIPTNKWTHVACTNDGSTVRTYIDGIETASEPLMLSGMPPSAEVHIGSNEPDGADPLIGMLDEMRVFDYARSSAEICAAAGPNCP